MSVFNNGSVPVISLLTQSIKKTLRRAGIEVHHFNPSASPAAQLAAALSSFEIDLIFDIGANTGQFAKKLRVAGYTGRIVSVEPLTTAHSALVRESRYDPKWHIHTRCAIGDYVGEVNLNISSNSLSSSVLPMLSSHSRAAPDSAYIGHEIAPLTTLDLVVPDYLAGARAPFLKIDTQGYEWLVLDGAVETLPAMRGILIELSLVSLYEGQRLWQECIDRLEAEGFLLWALLPVFVDPANGRSLQLDGLFFRP
jgi:FkbM family methyltransferase